MATKASKDNLPASATDSRSKLSDNTLRIRSLNDALRRHGRGGRIVVTAGVAALSSDRQDSLLAQLRSFDAFTADNDPYGEHDFGRIEDHGERFFWKIDYYDRELGAHSVDPADSELTTRILTLMLADEY